MESTNRNQKDNDQVTELSNLSVEQLDSIALDGNHKLFSSTNRRVTSNIPTLAGGWVAAWIRSGASVQRMDLIIRPSDVRTREIYNQGLAAYATRFNLTQHDAEIWARAGTRGKHAILPYLAKILYSEDTLYREAYLSYPLNKDSNAVSAWYQKWFPEGTEQGFTDYDHVAIASLVNEIVNGTKVVPIRRDTERQENMVRTPYGLRRRKAG